MAQPALNSQIKSFDSSSVREERGQLDAPAALRMWHLASLDAPTVAVVWTLGFAWAAGVRLPVWVPVLLGLTAWAVYIGDRLLDARAGIRRGAAELLAERHWFHYRHRWVMGTLGVAAACAAAGIVFTLMPVAARERDSVLGLAALAYFTRVHSPRKMRPAGAGRIFGLVKKEFLVGVLFTAACLMPAFSRAGGMGLAAVGVVFALLAWLNCFAIDRWESGAGRLAGAKQTAEKLFALKGHGFSRAANPSKSARALAPEGCFSGRQNEIIPFPATCKALFDFAGAMRGLKPPPSSVGRTACGLAFAGMVAAGILGATAQPRMTALVLAGAVSSLLLAGLDRWRGRLTPLALRAAADLVLLTPLALLLPLALLIRSGRLW